MLPSNEQMRASVESIMREAGTVLLSCFHTHLERTQKGEDGFVTEADLVSERYLIKELSKLLPKASIFAEESGRSGQGEYCWVIDPLDGTTNFAQGLPYFCISVALTHKGVPKLGAIYQPLLDEFFYAEEGNGAFLNGQAIRVSQPQDFSKTVLVVGLPYAKNERFMHLLKSIETIAPKAYAFRHFGAAALDIAYVASGRLDGVFFEDLSWWDVAAGLVLIQEAGGVVSDFADKQIDENYTSFVAASHSVHQTLLGLLKY